jgi:probable rRNA maturation factor
VAVYLPPWRIDVQSRPGVPRVAPMRALARTVAATLSVAGALRPASIGLILSDDDELAELNAALLGHEGPTDVLSFPLLPPGAFPSHAGQDPRLRAASAAFALPPGRRIHLGDIVVSVERAVDQANDGRGGHSGHRRWSPANELRLLVTHGTLHICGWDHAEPAEEAAMRTAEQGLLALHT